MDSYMVRHVERRDMCQEVQLDGLMNKSGVKKTTTVSAWTPLVTVQSVFIVYNYWRDERAMVARAYKVDGKTHIDLMGGCSDSEIHAVYEMLGADDARMFTEQVVQALGERGVRASGGKYADLKKLMELQYIDAKKFQGRIR